MNRGLKLFVFIIVTLGVLTSYSFAQAPSAGKKEKITKHTATPKEVVGEITGVVPGRFVSVLFKQDKEAGVEEEILLPIDSKDMKFDHVKDLSGLNVGDTVRIQFDDERTEYDSGRKEAALKTKVIGLVKKGKGRQIPPEPLSEPEGVYRSEE